jgi:hypothetical protein
MLIDTQVEKMSLNPKDLKEKALKIKKSIVVEEKEHINLKHLQTNLTKLEEYINSYAEMGHLNLSYDFGKTTDTPFFINTVAQKFKDNNPDFSVVVDLGRRLIIVDWSGKNEV